MLAAAPAVLADTVTLTNGRELHGLLVEETEEWIRLRAPGGSITVPKHEVASFTADENWGGEYGDHGPAEGGPEAAPTEPAEPTEPPGQGSAGIEPWTWAAGVPPERIAAMEPIRDRLIGQLRALGPTPAERLRAAEASQQETERLNDLVERFAVRRANVRKRRGALGATPEQRVGRRRMLRDSLREEAVSFGPKAIPQLVSAVRDPSFWRRRMAVMALSELTAGEAGGEMAFDESSGSWVRTPVGAGAPPELARWLLYHFDAPAGLIEVLAVRGETMAPFLREEADRALSAITQHSVGYEPTTLEDPTPAEQQAAEEWRRWWKEERARWTGEEQRREERRNVLVQALNALREGRDPGIKE